MSNIIFRAISYNSSPAAPKIVKSLLNISGFANIVSALFPALELKFFQLQNKKNPENNLMHLMPL